jgi:ComF family protein
MCGRPLLGEEELCTSCRERRFRISSITPLGMYRGALARVLQAYKLQNHRLLARFFAELLAPRFAEWGADGIVTCVPSRPASLRKRGWDHTGEIMRILCSRYGVRAVPLLTRRAGRAQKELDFQARMQNLQGKIALARTPRPDIRLEGREVLCFDDVLTTGASLEACAAELLSAGVKSVRAIVIAADP